MIGSGVQDATRPRTGPSPPDRHADYQVHTNLLSPEQRTRARHEGGPSWPTVTFPSARTSISSGTRRRICCAPSGAAIPPRSRSCDSTIPSGSSPHGQARRCPARAGPQLRPAELAAPGARLPDDRRDLARRRRRRPRPGAEAPAAAPRGRARREGQLGAADVVRRQPRAGRIIAMLRELGAADVQFAFDRACLQGKIETARRLYAMGARPVPALVMGPCETQSGAGSRSCWSWARSDRRRARRPAGAGRADPRDLLPQPGRASTAASSCAPQHGIELPDTPPMAVHRGRIDLLEAASAARSGLLARTFSHEEIYPPELGLPRRPVAGAARHAAGGRDAAAPVRRLRRDRDRALAARARRRRQRAGRDRRRRLRRAHGAVRLRGLAAAANRRATTTSPACCSTTAPIRTSGPRCGSGCASWRDETMHEYRDVTPLAWGERFHDQDWVSRPAMRLIAERGGHL